MSETLVVQMRLAKGVTNGQKWEKHVPENADLPAICWKRFEYHQGTEPRLDHLTYSLHLPEDYHGTDFPLPAMEEGLFLRSVTRGYHEDGRLQDMCVVALRRGVREEVTFSCGSCS